MPDIAQSEVDSLGAFRHVASRYGGSPASIDKKIEDLEADNRKQREEIRGLKAQVPPDGSVVMSKADADLLNTFKELGDPKDVKAKLDSGDAAMRDVAQIKQKEAARSFAKAAGLADETVDTLTAIPALNDAKFEVRQVKGEDGVEKDVAYVTLNGEGKQAMKFEDAQNEVPALKGLARATPAATPPGGPVSNSDSLRFVVQTGGTGGAPPAGGTKTPAELAIERNRAAASAPNALRPAKNP